MPGRDTIWAGVATLAAVVFLVGCVWLGFEAGSAKRQAAKLDAEINTPQTGLRDRLATCKSTVGNLEAGIDMQNRTVEALRLEGEERTAAALKAVADAERGRRVAEGRVRALLRERPRDGEGVCAAADRLILENAG